MTGPQFRKTALTSALALAALLVFWACDRSETPPAPRADFRIAVVVPGGDRPDIALALETLTARYGRAADGGLIETLVLDGKSAADVTEAIDRAASPYDNPMVQAVVVLEGPPGTTEAFSRIRTGRPEVELLAAEPREAVSPLAATSDLVVLSDPVAGGYLTALAAQRLSARTLVQVSLCAPAADEPRQRRRAVLSVAAADLGLALASETIEVPRAKDLEAGDAAKDSEAGEAAKDSEAGAAAGAAAKDPETGEAPEEAAVEESIASKVRAAVGALIERHGPAIAFVPDDDALIAPLAESVAALGGHLLVPDGASPALVAAALGVDPGPFKGDWAALVKALDKAAGERDLGGRLGVWPTPLASAHLGALVELARRAVLGEVDLADPQAVRAIYEPGGDSVSLSVFADQVFVPTPNAYLARREVRLLGSEPATTAEDRVPPRYAAVAMDQGVPKVPPFHVAILTDDAAQGDEDLLGAVESVRRHGAAGSGGLIRHLVYSDEHFDNPVLTVALIESLAADPLLRVVVINQAAPGTAEGFRRLKARRPDVWRLAGEPHEDVAEIASAADLVLAADFITRGYLIPYVAKEMGAKTLVHVSFERHLAYDTVALRLKIMEEASKDLGLGFHQEIVPDPVIDLEAAVESVSEAYPGWLAKYGAETAFFATNDAQTVPILRRVAELGGYFVTADIPSTLLGYPEAFGVDVDPFLGRWVEILGLVERAAVEAGGAGRMGVWAYPLGFAQSAGLVEFGKLLAEGSAEATDIDALLEVLGSLTPGSRWSGGYLNDLVTGKPLRSFFLLHQDVYVMGRGYLPTTKVEVPQKYYEIRLD